MSTPVRIAGFVLGLVAVFIAARGVGAVTGPVAGPATGPTQPMAHDEMTDGEDADGDAHGAHEQEESSEASETPGGLQVSEQGYTFRVISEPRRGADRLLRFTIDGPDGEPVTSYDEVHEQPLHLIKIRRDGAGFQHVHPTLGADGVWTVRLTLSPGSSRLFADFTPTDGPALILGTDVEVGGAYEAADPTPITRVARVDGYRVELTGDLVAGESSPLTLSVSRKGEPVTDLQPYLGAYGHLVALREGDLAYLHVHPEEPEGSAAGPEIPFLAEVPSEGRYRLFLDFRHDGVVRTAEFTLAAQEGHGHEH